MGSHTPYERDVFVGRLKSLRKERKLKQEELAQMVDKSKGAVGHWEAGTREPSVSTVYHLAKIFGVSIDYMMGNSDFRNENEAVDYMLLKLRECGLVRNDTIDKETVDKLIEYISAIEKIKRD